MPVNQLFQLKPHPFRSLLYVEWILLALTVIKDLPWYDLLPYLRFLKGKFPEGSQLNLFSWLLIITCLVAIGLMGLKLPTGKKLGKWFYILLQLGLIWLATSALISLNDVLMLPYLIVVIRSCVIFKPRERILVSSLVVLSFLLLVIIALQDTQSLQSQLTQPRSITLDRVRILAKFITFLSTFGFGLIVALVLMVVNALLSERQSKQELAIARDRLRQYAILIEDRAILQERNRIAREIHDSLGHTLTAQSIQLENALLFCQSHPDKTQTFLTQAKQLTATALKDIRHSVSTLRSDPLQNQTLTKAIASLIESFRNTTNIAPNCLISLQSPLSCEVNTAVYRIVQESLTNIAKHGKASKVILKLETVEKYLHLAIEDNGKGFNPQQNTTGFGLQGMRERTLALRGNFTINSTPGSGCKIKVKIPLADLAIATEA